MTHCLQVVEIRRTLARKRLEHYNPSLTDSLRYLACNYRALNEFKVAVTYGLQAVEILRTLVRQQPEDLNPYLAGAFDNLVHDHRKLGEFENSAVCRRQADEIRRVPGGGSDRRVLSSRHLCRTTVSFIQRLFLVHMST